MDKLYKQGGLTMKRSRTVTLLLISIITLFSLLLFHGCENQTPLAPVTADNSQVTGNTTIDKNLRILHLGGNNRSLQKASQVSKFIYAKAGGSLYLSHSNSEVGLYASMGLVIPPNSMNQDAEVSLTLDDMDFKGALDVVFSPHGTTFGDPALLTIKAEGIDLTGINPNSLWIYYDNPVTGQWEPMVCERFMVGQGGWIYILNAELPHFSRYAVGDEQ
jgi:hypothetical protein